MLKSYAVVSLNQRTGKVGMDIFSDGSPGVLSRKFN